MQFKQYLLESENSCQEDIKKTLAKLPKSHSALIKGFKYEFQNGNTLKNDNEHVGLIDVNKKKIIIAASYRYGREHVLLHELAHQIYNKLSPELKRKWAEVAKNTKMEKEDRQNAEELFCHSYAAHYSKNPPSKFDHPGWHKFIENLPDL